MLFGLLALLLPLVYSDGVSIQVNGHDEICVFAQTKHRNEKVAFYYSVNANDGPGEFGVAVQVKNTKNEVVLEVAEEDTGDYVFSANDGGEFTFCFENHYNGNKMVYVDVTVESDTYNYDGEFGSEIAKPPSTADTKQLKQVKSQLDGQLSTINSKMDTLHKQMQFIKMREGRSISTVKSTQSRIRWFTFLESSLMVGISVAQVFLIRTFFSRPGRGMSRI